MTSGAIAQTEQTPTERLTQLHDSLHLNAEQDTAWRSYVAAIESNQQGSTRRRATQQLLPQLTTPRRIALIDATMEQDLTDLHRDGEAVLAFYNRLTPEQQATFDHETLPPTADQPQR